MFHVVIDIGSPGKNLGWAALNSSGIAFDGTNIDRCIELIAQELSIGPVTLGFEAPMWIPTRSSPTRLTAARSGETGPGLASRPFSASAGATVLVTGMVVVTYVLRRLRCQTPNARPHFDWRSWPKMTGDLLLWEAFVTNQKKTHDERHVEDAQLALTAFTQGLENPECFNSSVTEPDFINLIGVALLKAGWTTDPNVLNEACLVVRTN